jgi:hypothetical protein
VDISVSPEVSSGLAVSLFSSAVADVEEELGAALVVICCAGVFVLVLVTSRELALEAAEELELDSQFP